MFFHTTRDIVPIPDIFKNWDQLLDLGLPQEVAEGLWL